MRGDEEDETREDVRTEKGQRAHVYSPVPGGCWPLCSSSSIVQDVDQLVIWFNVTQLPE